MIIYNNYHSSNQNVSLQIRIDSARICLTQRKTCLHNTHTDEACIPDGYIAV